MPIILTSDLGSSLVLVWVELWCRDGGIPQGCPLSMLFSVALYVPGCRKLEVMPSVRPQLCADTTCNAVLSALGLSVVLLVSLLSLSGLWVRMCLLGSVSS